MNMEEASKRLLAEHRRMKARSSRMLSVLLLFAAAYLMTGMKWAVLPGIVYLAIVYQKIGNGRALIARAYQQEEKTFLKQINALIQRKQIQPDRQEKRLCWPAPIWKKERTGGPAWYGAAKNEYGYWQMP